MEATWSMGRMAFLGFQNGVLPHSLPVQRFHISVAVLVRVSIATTKHHDQRASWVERVYLAYTSALLFITKGSQDRSSNRAGTWRQELMQRLWKDGDYWLASHGLYSLLSYRTQDHQPREGWITNRENASQLDLIEPFPQLSLLLL